MKRRVICVIMGGGRGTRLHPLTQQRCKPAVPLAGKYRLVDIPISNCLNSDLNQIFVLTQFNTASLHRHIQESYKFDPFGGGFVDILAAEQTEAGDYWYQGTADAVRQNLIHFNVQKHDLFLILSGDQLYRMDFRPMIEQHLQSASDVTVAATPVPVAEASSLGLMRVDDSLQIREFVEKPRDPKVIESLIIAEEVGGDKPADGSAAGGRCLASMGLYLFEASVLRRALESDHADFGKEVIPNLLGQRRLGAYVFDGYWEDIGTVRAFFEANLRLTDHVPPFNFFDENNRIFTRARYLPSSKINRADLENCVIADACILTDVRLKRCVIGVRSTIRTGSVLENVVMMGADMFDFGEALPEDDLPKVRLGVGPNCRIRNTIIDKNARIGAGVQLDPQGKPENFAKDGIILRDGVLIVPKDAVVPDGYVF